MFTVLEVKKLKMPELNDEFARSCDFEDVADLRKGIRGYWKTSSATSNSRRPASKSPPR